MGCQTKPKGLNSRSRAGWRPRRSTSKPTRIFLGFAVECLYWRCQSLTRDPARSALMTRKRRIPRLDPEFACFKLQIHRSSIERFGVFTEETIPPGKKVIQYTGERIGQRKAVRRAVRMFLAGKAE